MGMKIGSLAVLGLFILFFFRLMPSDPKFWHVDPLSVVKTKKPNQFLMRPEGGDDASPEFKFATEDMVTKLKPFLNDAKLLAGDLDQGWATYVFRSKLLGYPDYVSIRILEEEGMTRLAIYSRSRFGHSDLGVNQRRVTRWMAQL